MRPLTEHEVFTIERRPRCHECGLRMGRNDPGCDGGGRFTYRCMTPTCSVAQWWDALPVGELHVQRTDFNARFDFPLDDGIAPARAVLLAVAGVAVVVSLALAAVVWLVGR